MSDQTHRAMHLQPTFVICLDGFLMMNTVSRSVHEGVRLMKREVSEETLAGMCEICRKEDAQRRDPGHSALGREQNRRRQGWTPGPKSAEHPRFRDSLATKQE